MKQKKKESLKLSVHTAAEKERQTTLVFDTIKIAG